MNNLEEIKDKLIKELENILEREKDILYAHQIKELAVTYEILKKDE